MSNDKLPIRGTLRFVFDKLKWAYEQKQYIRQIYECYVAEIGEDDFTVRAISVIGGDGETSEVEWGFYKSVVAEGDLSELELNRYCYITVVDDGTMVFDFPRWPGWTPEEIAEAQEFGRKWAEIFNPQGE